MKICEEASARPNKVLGYMKPGQVGQFTGTSVLEPFIIMASLNGSETRRDGAIPVLYLKTGRRLFYSPAAPVIIYPNACLTLGSKEE